MKLLLTMSAVSCQGNGNSKWSRTVLEAVWANCWRCQTKQNKSESHCASLLV